MEHQEDKLTPEQQIALEKAKKEADEARLAVRNREAELDALKERRQRIVRADVISSAIQESGIKWQDNEVVGSLLASEHQLQVNSDGVATCVVNDKRVPVVEALKEIAQKRGYLVSDRRTLPAELRKKHGDEEQRPQSKSELRTVAEKVEAINKWGGDWYESLPVVPPPSLKNVSELSRSEWLRLPLHEKTRIVSELTAEGQDAAQFIGNLR